MKTALEEAATSEKKNIVARDFYKDDFEEDATKFLFCSSSF